MRLRNDTGSPLEIRRYGRTVPPGQEIDSSELVDADGPYDPDKHGVITGMTPVPEEPAPRQTTAKPAKAATADGSDK